jgi:signal transduction histidine kinase
VSRLRERLAPILAGLLVVIVGAAVVFMLRLAGDQGTTALRTAKLGQVNAIANSFNARYAAQISDVAGFSSTNWELVPGSKADNKLLQTFNRLNPNAESGFFLLDKNDTITAGVLLRAGRLGSHYAPPGWAGVKARLAKAGAVVMPVVNNSQTTELPSYGFAVAVVDKAGNLRGALVAEQALTATSPFQKEILQLRDPKEHTTSWQFIDSAGTVVASTASADLGRPVPDPRYRTGEAGLATIDGRLVVTADVPALGWRVVFRQDRSEFESPLSGPLQDAALVLVLLLLGVGLTLVVVFVRRLRESREQERRLRELTRAQGEFISVVSHELRTPVTGVLGFLQTTVDHWPTLSVEDRFIAVCRAVTNAKRLKSLTSDVLDIDWIESGRMGYVPARRELAAELITAAEDSEAIDANRPVTVRAPAGIMVDVDPDRFQQVLSNLLDNARKNAPAHEPIQIEAEVHAESTPPVVRIAVIDAGPGVDAESAERIFQKFVRVNDNAVTGTGLGLYIARQIIEAHGGRIWCESEPGAHRTAFLVELPVVADAPEDPTADLSPPDVVATTTTGGRPHLPGQARGRRARRAEL